MGRIITFTGPSGVGKTTIAKALIERRPEMRMVPSLTTRPSRPNDIDGEYRRVTPKHLRNLAEEGRLLWNIPHGTSLYATAYKAVTDILNEPNAIGIMILVPQVLPHLDKFLRDLRRGQMRTSVFLVPPSPEVFYERIAEGGRDLEEIRERHQTEKAWEAWAVNAGLGFHFVTNTGTVEETAAEVLDLLA